MRLFLCCMLLHISVNIVVDIESFLSLLVEWRVLFPLTFGFLAEVVDCVSTNSTCSTNCKSSSHSNRISSHSHCSSSSCSNTSNSFTIHFFVPLCILVLIEVNHVLQIFHVSQSIFSTVINEIVPFHLSHSLLIIFCSQLSFILIHLMVQVCFCCSSSKSCSIISVATSFSIFVELLSNVDVLLFLRIIFSFICLFLFWFFCWLWLWCIGLLHWSISILSTNISNHLFSRRSAIILSS